GSVVLDNSRAPVLVGTSTKTFRYWLTGAFAASGKVTLTTLPDTWAFNVTDFDLTDTDPGLTAPTTVPGSAAVIFAGPVNNGDTWTLTVDGTAYNHVVQPGDQLGDELAGRAGTTADAPDSTGSGSGGKPVANKTGGGALSLRA